MLSTSAARWVALASAACPLHTGWFCAAEPITTRVPWR
jgi:hypothetical protein